MAGDGAAESSTAPADGARDAADGDVVGASDATSDGLADGGLGAPGTGVQSRGAQLSAVPEDAPAHASDGSVEQAPAQAYTADAV